MERSEWQMTASLSDRERTRREEVAKAILGLRKNLSAESVRKFVEDSETRLCRAFAKEGVLPTLSAKFFFWYLDKRVWVTQGKNPRPFPFLSERPEKYGPPYSETYLSHLLGVDRDAAAAEDVRLMEQAQLAPIPMRSDSVEMPDDQDRHPELLSRLWQKMFPERAVKMLIFQADAVRRIALQEAPKVAPPAATGQDRLEVGLETVSRFVKNPRFGCLPRYELLGMVEEAAVDLVRTQVTRMISSCSRLEVAEREFTLFVFDTKWDDVVAPEKRLEVCERLLSHHPKTRRPLYEWVAKMRLRMAAEGGGESFTKLAEKMAKRDL